MIGWYVHHHGRGHLHRAQAVAAHMDERVVGLSTHPPQAWADAWVRLPDDAAGGRTDPTANGRLHYAPIDNVGHRERLAMIVSWVRRARPRLVVVDVSVEVAVLVRTLGVPVVVMAMPGVRDDPAHTLAYDLADQIIAPWPRSLYEPDHLRRVAGKVTYVGGISVHENDFPDRGCTPRTVAVITGQGGTAVTADQVSAAQRDTPEWTWVLAGPPGAWVTDITTLISTAQVCVIGAGQNSVADIAAADTAAVVLPQQRPFQEQHATAAVLRGAGLATVARAWPARWGRLLDAAADAPSRWSLWQVSGAAQRAADSIGRA